MNLNAKTTAGIALPTEKTDHIMWDGTLTGFGYRIRAGAGGKLLRSWVVQYKIAGATRRMTLGSAGVLTADQARGKAKKILAKVALGEDPQADKAGRRARDEHTFASVVETYLAAKRPILRKRTLVEVSRYLSDATYFGALHGRPIDVIERKDVAACLVAITGDSSSIVAAKARAVVSALFVWCMQMGFVKDNPVIGTIQPQDSKGRTRVLSDIELAAIWNACGDGSEYGKVVRLLILTGARRQEIGGLAWMELDPDTCTWTLPASRAKNKRAHTLPLPASAREIIAGVPHMAGRDQLFGTRSAAGFTEWGNGKAALDERLGDTVEPWTLHDLRRATATGMANIGVQPHIIEQILNHVSGHRSGIAGVYNRSSYDRDVKAAMMMWADHIHSVVTGTEHRILPFGSTAAS